MSRWRRSAKHCVARRRSAWRYAKKCVIWRANAISLIGVKVPDDLSVISCDDYSETAFFCPPISVIDIPNRELGYQAAKLVFRRIRNLPPLPVEDFICLDGKLIERESVRAI